VKKTIREAAVRHADTILNKLRELQVDLRSNPVIFIGGGAVLFKDCLEGSPNLYAPCNRLFHASW